MKKVKITTAGNMSDETYEFICEKLIDMLGEEAQFDRVIDESIIGGFIADVSGRIYDLSLKTQLNKLKEYIG